MDGYFSSRSLSLTKNPSKPGKQELLKNFLGWSGNRAKEFHKKSAFLNPKSKKLKLSFCLLLSVNEIRIDGKVINFKMQAMKWKRIPSGLFFESEPVQLENIRVRNAVWSSFPNQQNIIHVYQTGKKPESLLLGKEMRKGAMNFKWKVRLIRTGLFNCTAGPRLCRGFCSIGAEASGFLPRNRPDKSEISVRIAWRSVGSHGWVAEVDVDNESGE
jgi:hypothetical protein